METKDFLKSIGFGDNKISPHAIQIELGEYGFDTHISLLASLIDTTEIDDLCVEFNALGCTTEYDDEKTIVNFGKTHRLKYKEGTYFIDNDICDFNFTYFVLQDKTERYIGIRFKSENQFYLFKVVAFWEEDYSLLPFTTYINRDYYTEEIAELWDAQFVFDGKVLSADNVLFLFKMIQDFPLHNGDDLYRVFFAYYYNDDTNSEYKEYVDNYFYNLQSNQKNQLNLF
jgi:hypothetical protein